MLELANVRHGAVVNACDGVESESALTIQVEGLAAPGSLVVGQRGESRVGWQALQSAGDTDPAVQ